MARMIQRNIIYRIWFHMKMMELEWRLFVSLIPFSASVTVAMFSTQSEIFWLVALVDLAIGGVVAAMIAVALRMRENLMVAYATDFSGKFRRCADDRTLIVSHNYKYSVALIRTPDRWQRHAQFTYIGGTIDSAFMITKCRDCNQRLWCVKFPLKAWRCHKCYHIWRAYWQEFKKHGI